MIRQSTFDFLSDLIANNNRDWFQANKERYDEARENVIDFTAAWLKGMHTIDPSIDETLDPKKCVMRIYRDIRFRKDKTPYKNNFGVSIPTNGTKLGRAEYYFQVSPGNSFIAGGYWMPEAEHLKKIRQEIDYNAADLEKIIDAPEFIKLFGDFREQEKLKTVPREYGADNPHIELLKLKSFVAFRNLKDKELLLKSAVADITKICSKIYPLNAFLNNALA